MPPGEDFFRGLAAIGQALAQCVDGATAAVICSLIATIVIVDYIQGFMGLKAIATTIGKFLGCVFANYFGGGGIAGPTGGGGPGGGGGGGGFGGFGCFPADTPVTLADGSRVPIERLTKGSMLRTAVWDRHYAAVDDVLVRDSDDLREIILREVRPGLRPLPAEDLALRVTGAHLVWSDSGGWTAASALKEGDWVHHESGALLEVVSSTPLPGTHTVYTIEVKGTNAFFASGVMVQDLCGGQKPLDRSVFDRTADIEPSTIPAQ